LIREIINHTQSPQCVGASEIMKGFFGIVYLARCVTSGKPYVGQTYSMKGKSADRLLEDRKRRHYNAAMNGATFPFHCAIRKYGADSFTWEIVARVVAKDRLDELEAALIISNNAMAPDGYNAVIQSGQVVFSEHTKLKMSQSATRRWRESGSIIKDQIRAGKDKTKSVTSEIYRQNVARTMHAPEARQKAQERLRVVMQSEAYRTKLSEVHKRKWSEVSSAEKASQLRGMTAHSLAKRRAVEICTPDGMAVSTAESIARASDITGAHRANINAVLRGVRSTANGFVFRYV
jgi:group I intron endonuclease